MAPVPSNDNLLAQLLWLFILAIPIATVAWTVTHEEVFREPREYCVRMSKTCRSMWQRKFFYVFTCEYCFSFWVTVLFLALTRYRLLIADWRGYVLAAFGVMWVANVYMNIHARLRVDIRSERAEADAKEREVKLREKETEVKEKEAQVREREARKLDAELGEREAQPAQRS